MGIQWADGMDTSAKAREYAPVILRLGMVVLFLWFGLSQVTDPSGWTSWLPAWTSSLPISATALVFLNGAFETVLGVALLLGFWTRVAAVLLSLHLLLIAYEVGYNDVGVRDFCLAVATAAVACFGADRYTFDTRHAPPAQLN